MEATEGHILELKNKELPPNITYYVATIPKKRKLEAGQTMEDLNEDSVLNSPEDGLLIICDGMGGHGGGRSASRSASLYLEDELSDTENNNPLVVGEQVHKALIEANTVVNQKSVGGTTAIVAKFFMYQGLPRFIIGSVGDSGAGLFRKGRFMRLNEYDYGFKPENSDQVEEVETHEDFIKLSTVDQVAFVNRNIIGKCLGLQRSNEEVSPQIIFGTLMEGDQVVLWSDGYGDNRNSKRTLEVLSTNPDNPALALAEAADNFSEENYQPGIDVSKRDYPAAKLDDISVGVAKVNSEALERTKKNVTLLNGEDVEVISKNEPTILPLSGRKEPLKVFLNKSGDNYLEVVSKSDLQQILSEVEVEAPFVLIDRKLVLETKGRRGLVELPPRKRVYLGRSSRSSIEAFDLPHSTSSRHAYIGLTGIPEYPELYLEDNGSTNGTYVSVS